MTSRRRTISNQRWNNVVYVNIQQCQINVVFFNVDVRNVRQRRNNVVIFNVEFHNVDQRRNNVVNTTTLRMLESAKKYFWASEKNDPFD